MPLAIKPPLQAPSPTALSNEKPESTFENRSTFGNLKSAITVINGLGLATEKSLDGLTYKHTLPFGNLESA